MEAEPLTRKVILLSERAPTKVGKPEETAHAEGDPLL